MIYRPFYVALDVRSQASAIKVLASRRRVSPFNLLRPSHDTLK